MPAFSPLTITEISELSLSGNMDIKEMVSRKIQWKTKDGHKLNKPEILTDDMYDLKLAPMAIRTFEVQSFKKEALFLN
jgi:hypothetical protein